MECSTSSWQGTGAVHSSTSSWQAAEAVTALSTPAVVTHQCAAAAGWDLEELGIATGLPLLRTSKPASRVGAHLEGSGIAEHPLQMHSAYSSVTGREPEFTSSHAQYCGTLDYIWYTPRSGGHAMQAQSVLQPPPAAVCCRPGILGHRGDWPSDHVSLVSNFSIVNV